MLSLAAFAGPLTLVKTAQRAGFAAYGDVYIAASLVWLWQVEGIRPDRWGLIGAFCLVGAAIIVFGPRAAAGAQPWLRERFLRCGMMRAHAVTPRYTMTPP